jgi:ABC-type Zn uptake system ZnuABC Zn-binding protein ZnuA
MILILIATGAAMLAATLTGCGSDDEGGKPVVAASTGILADITAEVGGEGIEVVQLIPDSASPHDFQPSAEDRQALADADLVIINGAGLDASVPIGDADAPTWELAENVGELLISDEGEDPHVWMDPTRVAGALPSLAAALGEIDSENAGVYEDRAQAFEERLKQLDDQIARQIEALPAPERNLVTSHDALGYFADRYGLTVVATPFPVAGPDAEPSAASLADVIEVVDETGTKALFIEETDDPEVLESVAAETGATVVDELLVEAPGSAGSYEAMLRHDGELIGTSLGG